jgi:hypothetical protein
MNSLKFWIILVLVLLLAAGLKQMKKVRGELRRRRKRVLERFRDRQRHEE